MISFLRKIRKTLVGSGQVRKYLIYAAGEVLLVMIGIILALQLNIWNEERKEQAQIKTYLSNLIDAINDDIAYLDYTFIGNAFRSDCIKYMLGLSSEKGGKNIPSLNYEINGNYVHNRPGTKSYDIWAGPIPNEYDRNFAVICFDKTSYGNIIVINQSALDEFKNTGLFSSIKNEKLKKKINDYYGNMNWHFSDWREANFRGQIDEWEDFLRHKYQIIYSDLSEIENPIDLIKKNRDLYLELEVLGIEATMRAKMAGDSKQKAIELISLLQQEISKM